MRTCGRGSRMRGRLMRPLDAYPAEDRLVIALGRQLDGSMIDDIARADYGNQFEEHRAAIVIMIAGGPVPQPGWVPQEVLELIRWSEPEYPEWKPGGHGSRGHKMRAFCCAAQLRIIGAAGHDGGDDITATLGHLLVSLDALPEPDWIFCRQFLDWFGRCLGAIDGYDPTYSEEPALVLVGRIFAAASQIQSHGDLPDLMAAYLKVDERRTPSSADERWPISAFTLAAPAWRTIGRRLVALSGGITSQSNRELLALIGTTLLPNE
jgi:hypothetical protein